MSIDRADIAARVAAHGRVARVVVAMTSGSAPRETGTAMLVWADGQSGTIGGGALEHMAAREARKRLALADKRVTPLLDRHALGPSLGQCCGGAVVLLTEVFSAVDLATIPDCGLYARPVLAGAADMPLAVRRLLTDARGAGVLTGARLVQGWMVEPIARPARSLWLWGAGHVGRALVSVLSPLPDFSITWVDTSAVRFPDDIPEAVMPCISDDPPALARLAPPDAEHLVVTYSHELDLALCHAILQRPFRSAGLIGSATKWARFRARLSSLGHAEPQIARIVCPIGDPALGKHPHAIAVGVAASLLQRPGRRELKEGVGQ